MPGVGSLLLLLEQSILFNWNRSRLFQHPLYSSISALSASQLPFKAQTRIGRDFLPFRLLFVGSVGLSLPWHLTPLPQLFRRSPPPPGGTVLALLLPVAANYIRQRVALVSYRRVTHHRS